MVPGLPIGLFTLLTLAQGAPAAAESIPIRVDFEAPAGCSSVDAFYTGLLTRMDRARRAAAGEDAVHLSVRLTRAGARVRGELRLLEGPGGGDTRRVEGESCDAVVEVLSLTAALALTAQPARVMPPPPPPPPPPVRVSPPARSSSSSSSSSSSPTKPPESSAPPQEPAPPPEPPPPPPPPPPAAVLVTPAPPQPLRGRHYQLGLQAVAADVISSSVSVGGGLAARIEGHGGGGPGASLGLTFLYVPNDLVQSADDVSVRWFALAAIGCPGWGLGRVLTVQPCAQAIGGWLAATGQGLTNPRSVGRTWWSVGALLRAGAHFGGGFSLELEAGATVPLIGRRFVSTTPERTVGETPTVSPIVALGLSRSL